MTIHTCRDGLTLLVVAFVVETAGIFVSPVWAQRADTLIAPQQMTGLVKHVEVIMRYRDRRVPSYNYGHFAPTRVRAEGKALIIEGRIAELPSEDAVDITIRLRTTIPSDEDVDSELYDDYREEIEREGES